MTCGVANITIRSVLTHTASAQVNTRFADNGYLFGKLVEILIAAIDGKSAEEIFRHRVIDAIGLDRSAAGVSDPFGADVVDALASPHRLDQENQPVPQRLMEGTINTGAGFFASAPDAARVFMAVMAGDFLYDGLANDLMKKVVLKNGALSPYRYGVFVEDLRGGRWFGIGAGSPATIRPSGFMMSRARLGWCSCPTPTSNPPLAI